MENDRRIERICIDMLTVLVVFAAFIAGLIVGIITEAYI